MFSNLTPESAQVAIDKRETLLRDGCFSRPAIEGRTAVLTSFRHNVGRVSPIEERKLRSESRAILETLISRGVDVVDAVEPTVVDMQEVLTDPSITSMCLIGEGAIGNLYVSKDGAASHDRGKDFDWRDVGRTANHLKTGDIFQRMCSVVSFSPVVWGTFAAADLPRIWVSKEANFVPTEVHTEPSQELMTVYNENTVTYDSLVRLAADLNVRRVRGLVPAS